MNNIEKEFDDMIWNLSYNKLDEIYKIIKPIPPDELKEDFMMAITTNINNNRNSMYNLPNEMNKLPFKLKVEALIYAKEKGYIKSKKSNYVGTYMGIPIVTSTPSRELMGSLIEFGRYRIPNGYITS
jgi:hypothetical protein